MQVGDLIRNKRHPQAGTGVVTHVDPSGLFVLAEFQEYGEEIVYADEIEAVDESR